MSSGEVEITPSLRAIREFEAKYHCVRANTSALQLWDRYLTDAEKDRLGGDLEAAWRRLGTAGMWAELRGVTVERAVVEVAHQLGFLREGDRQWLLREIGEEPDVDMAIDQAIDAGHFVLKESPRAAYWNREQIDIDWNTNGVLWEFLWQLGRHGKAGRPIDRFTFGESASRDIVAKRKSRLTSMPEFPVDLGDAIESVGPGTQQLILPRERIRIFALAGLETLEEWHP